MQYELLDILKCPLTRTDLKFVLISEFQRDYGDTNVNEINEALLISESGFIFPVIDGIPRMLIESLYDYSDFLSKHLENYPAIISELEEKYSSLLQYCIKKNSRTKRGFEFEWSFLNAEKKDRIWHEDISHLFYCFF